MPRTIDDLRHEFLEHGFSGWVWEWLLDVLVEYVRHHLRGRYRASLYSPSREWDDAGMYDLVNEFLTNRVFNKALMGKALMVAETPTGVSRYLEKAFHHYTIKERGHSLARNVYQRLRLALEDDKTVEVMAGIGTQAAYGLLEWMADPPPTADATSLLGAEAYLPGDLKTTVYHSDRRRSPVLERKELLRAAHALIRGVGRPMNARQILAVISQRFDLEEARVVETEDESLASLPGDFVHPLEQIVAEETAERLLVVLTPRQQAVLRFWIEEPVLGCREIAARLGCSKSTVTNERAAIVRATRDLGLLDRGEQAQAILVAGELLEAAESGA